jgi:predicted nucleotidyltransferase
MMHFLDVSTARDLEPVAFVLEEILAHAQRLDIEIMLVGAVARDILIRHYVGQDPARVTVDVDIAAAVASWVDVDHLTASLRATPRVPHKFVVRGMDVDIIPFGRIESTERTITWPNDHKMDVFGFQEALNAAIQVKLPGGLTIAVASLPAQSLLKLFAWRGRHYRNTRDAIDLKTILHAYHEGPYHDALYTEHSELLERHDFDPATAGAERIGLEASALLPLDDRHVVDLLSSEPLMEALAADMRGRISDNRAMLTAYAQGFTNRMRSGFGSVQRG